VPHHVRVTRDTFAVLNLAHVDRQACLKHLSASVSKSPTELAPVRPVLEFSMVDPRFITETDAIGVLDDRPNLLEFKFTEFESLIQNLFTKMGLEPDKHGHQETAVLIASHTTHGPSSEAKS
jgi:restriction system protein